MRLKIVPLSVLVAFSAQSIQVPATLRNEYEIKAGYLLNFVEFIDWPSGAFPHSRSPIILGILGKDPFGAELEKLQSKVTGGRQLEIKRFKGSLEFRGEETPGRRQDDLVLRKAKKLAELKSCHILFISSSERNYVPLILKPLKGSSVLTVGETQSFAHEGGIVNFFDDGNRVQLEINLDAAEEARLKISSKLLSLAKIVSAEHPEQKR